MNIKLYDIGRADCVLLSEQNQNLLIDCGVKRADISNSMDINNDLSYSDNQLLITHFHNDHIRGLDHIYGDVFDKIYMSKYGICLFDNKQIDILTLFLKLYAYTPSKTKMNIYLKNLLRLCRKLSKVIKKDGNVVLLNKGDSFTHIRKFEVLHPDIKCNDLISDDLQNLAVEYISEAESGLSKKALTAIDTFVKEYIEIVNSLNINPEDKEFDFNQVITIKTIRQLDKLVRELRIQAKSISEYPDFDAVNKAFKRHMNETSLVVHNEDLLFAGDVTSSIISTLQSSKVFHEAYQAIKLPHHGSNSHFSMNLPFADFHLACSNSIKWDIKEDNQYLNTSLKSMTIFSNGDVFHNGRIFHKFYDNQIKINL